MGTQKAGDQAVAGVAILGLAERIPGARDLVEFWDNLTGGIESVSFFSDCELIDAGLSAAALKDQRYVKAAPVLNWWPHGLRRSYLSSCALWPEFR